MPELPELQVACRRLAELVPADQAITEVELASPFLLRTVEVPLEQVIGTRLVDARRFGKHLGLALEGERRLWLVFHLMLAGRLDWRPAGRALPRRQGCLKLTFGEAGALVLLERGTRKQAALYLVERPDQVERVTTAAVDPLGSEFTVAHLTAALRARNRQLKGALTDARVVGLGNAYSDEALWSARLSPLKLTEKLTEEELLRLHAAIRATLEQWIDTVDASCPGQMPTDQRKWRSRLRIHGRWREACPACGDPIERISYKETETNYCPTCQNEGKTLADRRLSRFLK